jgi:hypothetical protein
LSSHSKKFHLQELDWVLSFPDSGNKGKYLDYTVTFTDRKKKPTKERCLTLAEILGKTECEDRYPHTVGFFKNSPRTDDEFKPDYMEIRIITCIEDFWLFLNALNL